jgi:hypothetical protein
MASTQFQANGPNHLNNATVIYQSRFDPKKFTDQNFLYNNYTKDSFTVYKGLLSLWNQRQIINTPLLQLTELSNSVMYIPNTEGRFRYSIPYDLNAPYIVENIEKENPFPGRDGQKFKIKLSENAFTNTDVLTVDMRDGVQIVVTEDEIYEENGGWVYTVEVLGSSRRGMYYPQEYMQPGKQYVKLQNVNGEYSTQMSSISSQNLRTGFMDLEMELGGGHRSVTHWITGYADMMRVDEKQHPHLAFINQRLENKGGVTLYANTDQKGRIIPSTISWHNTVEMLLRAEMETMSENGNMWANGGFVSAGEGRKKIKVAAGLYSQLRNGNRVVYNKITLELIERQVANLFYNSGIPIEQRKTKIMTGQGGINQISKELYDRLKTINPYLVQGKDIPGGLFYGDVHNAGFVLPRFTKYFSPVAGWIEFEHNPALDNVYGLRDQDGLVGEYPVTSYTYMVLDITDKNVTNATARINTKYRVENGFNSSSNIVLVKPQDYGDLYWGYIIGTHSPFGPSDMKGLMSANSYNGFQIWMKSFGSIWVKDVTRTLLIEKAKPGVLYNN